MFPDEATESRSDFERFCDTGAEATAVVLGEYLVYVDPKDTSITPHLVRDGYWESWVSLAIARHVRPGMRCVDAGANVGYFTLLMASRGAAHVFAVEPAPDTAALLRRTIEANGLLSRVEVVEVALGAGPGRDGLMSFGTLRGSDSFVMPGGYEVTKVVEVKVQPLDLIVGRRGVDFVKIDVEGYEAEAWAGMEFVRKWNPEMVVCMEVLLREGFDALAFLKTLAYEKHLSLVEEDGSLTPTTPVGFIEHPMTAKHRQGMVWLT